MLNKKKLLGTTLLLGVFSSNMWALNLKEAIDIALQNNASIQSKNFEYKQSVESINLNNANFLPRVDLAYSYNNRNKTFSTQLDEDLTLSAVASYNLFNGFKDKSNKEASKFLSLSSKYYLNSLKQDIILDTKTAYINYLDKYNALETFKSAYVLFQEQYDDSKNRFDQGLIARNDLLQVQVNMSSAKQNVVKAQGNLKIAKYKLSNILGGKNLENETFEKLEKNSLIVSSYNEKDLNSRNEIKALENMINSNNQYKKANKSAYYPKVDASFTHSRFYNDLAFATRTETITNQNVANLSASWNLYSGERTKTQDDIYKLKNLQYKSQLTETKLNIKLQYENAKSNLEVAIDNLKTAKLSLVLARDNYKIVKNRFNEGVSSSTDLTDANYLLTQAKQNYYRAYFDKFLAIASLDRIFEKDVIN